MLGGTDKGKRRAALRSEKTNDTIQVTSSLCGSRWCVISKAVRMDVYRSFSDILSAAYGNLGAEPLA